LLAEPFNSVIVHQLLQQLARRCWSSRSRRSSTRSHDRRLLWNSVPT
jgi:hypothetical protein